MKTTTLGFIAIDIKHKIIYTNAQDPYDVWDFDTWARDFSFNNPDVIDEFEIVKEFSFVTMQLNDRSISVVIFFDINSDPWHLKYLTN